MADDTLSSSLPPAPSSNVEVQRDTSSKAWYVGHIVKVVNQEKLLIGFEGDVWPPGEFPVSRVRKAPPRMSVAAMDRFAPQIGTEVECFLNATDHAPACWEVTVVRKIKNTFFFVARSSDGSNSSEMIVEKDRLRPIGHASALSPSAMSQESFKIPKSLAGWASSSEGAAFCNRIEDQCSLIHVGVVEGGFRLVGDAEQIKRAKMLLEVHVKHQTQIHNFQGVREKRLTALEEKRNRIEGSGYKHSVEFRIQDPSHVKRIIGKGGEAIRAVEEKYNVQVQIREHTDEQRILKIFGHSEEDVRQAREEVEYIEEAVDVDSVSSRNKWYLMGKLNEIKESSGLVYARGGPQQSKIKICGTRHAVDDAITMLETHQMYFAVFDQMDDAMEKILSDLQEHGDKEARAEWENIWWYESDYEGYNRGSRGAGGGWGGEKNGYSERPRGKGSDEGRYAKGSKVTSANVAGENNGYSEKPRGKGKSGKGKEVQANEEGEKATSQTGATEKANSASRDRNAKAGAKSGGKDDGKGSVGKTQKGSSDWGETQYDDDEEDHRGGRSIGRQWKAKSQEHKEETTEEHTKDDEEAEKGGRSRGRQWKAKAPEYKEQTIEQTAVGARAKGAKRGGGRGDKAGENAEDDQTGSNSVTVERPERPPPGSRRMGKKGVRSGGAD